MQGMVSATVADVIAVQATKAQPVSVRCLRRAVVPLTTPSAMAEGLASVTAVSVRRDTNVHDARYAQVALIHARPNCKESKLPLSFYFLINIKGVVHQITVFGDKERKKVAPLMVNDEIILW